MKERLFKNLDTACAEFKSASAGVQNVHANRAKGSYNSTVIITWTEKKHLIGKIKCTHHKTIHHSRQEVRFDQQRFDTDLANANKVLQKAQNKLSEAKQAIQGEINSANSVLANHSSLVSTNSNLKSSVSANKAKLAHLNTYNTGSALNSHMQTKASLDGRKYQGQQSKTDFTRKSQQNTNEIQRVKSDIERQKREKESVYTAREASNKALMDKILSLDEVERAKVAYKLASINDESMLAKIKECGCWFEFAVYIAASKNDKNAFDRLLKEKIDVDSSIDEQNTLALAIISSGNNDFIEKIYSLNQSLDVTAYIAFMNNDFDSLKIMLKHDSQIIDKIANVEASGLSAVQLAISDSDVEKIKFIKEHSPASLNNEIVGYSNVLDMALTYNNPEIIQEIVASMTKDDLRSELDTIISRGFGTMLDRLIDNVDMQDGLHDIYKQAVENDNFAIRNMLIGRISDVKKLFASLIEMNDFDILMEIVELRGDVITARYLEELISAGQDSTASEMLQYLHENLDSESISSSLVGVDSVIIAGEDS